VDLGLTALALGDVTVDEYELTPWLVPDCGMRQQNPTPEEVGFSKER